MSGPKRRRTARHSYGYSLVEVSLALLVVGIGLVAVFGLFPEGLRSARRSVDDAQTAAFAQFVFASLEYVACTNRDWSKFTSGLELMH
ncbi:MAG TPA: prepilin-type N-terminal cleavage/methylation domain-containing protein, partial [Lentisphaerae bacterium]|nr:prepilin-type N-terminal cleavage/methylation domain-containing protein [Lentisphaerota bacterium]